MHEYSCKSVLTVYVEYHICSLPNHLYMYTPSNLYSKMLQTLTSVYPFLYSREQRVTAFFIHILIGVSVNLTMVLKVQ